jgi:hypothetical protein
VAWLLLTGAGLAVETVVIVVLGRTVTARYDAGDTAPARPDRIAGGGSRDIRVGVQLTRQHDSVRDRRP